MLSPRLRVAAGLAVAGLTGGRMKTEPEQASRGRSRRVALGGVAVTTALVLALTGLAQANGPAARIGEVLDVPLQRPRKRLEMAANQTYLKCRQRVLEFLYERHHFVEAA